MANFEALNDEAMEAASGGASNRNVNTDNWQGAHWQPTQYSMGTTFTAYGYLWYRIKNGDTLGRIAQTYGTTPAQLKANNPSTIKNINQIYAGDAIIIRRA